MQYHPGIPLPIHAATSTQVVHETSSGDVVRRTVLPNGVRVLTESMPGQRSVTLGCWVPVGSRDEKPGHHGATHFLEHLLFKGTPTRSAVDIANTFDAMGGESNAATGKEHTCYYARVLDDDLPVALDVLLDMLTSARLDPADVESERGVILEELAMNDDDPSDVAHEQFTARVLAGQELARPIGGTPETIAAITPDDITTHYRQTYSAHDLVIAAAGSVDHEWLCDYVTQLLRSHQWGTKDSLPTPRRSTDLAPLQVVTGQAAITRPLEQEHVVYGSAGICATDPRRYAVTVMNAVLGGGMSSRLFQEIREKRGLAYSVYSFASPYCDAGVFGAYAACTPTRTGDVIELMDECLHDMATDGVNPQEVQRAIGQICGATVLGLEDTSSRMSRLGQSELVLGSYIPVDDALSMVREVSVQDVQDMAQTFADQDKTLVMVGPWTP